MKLGITCLMMCIAPAMYAQVFDRDFSNAFENAQKNGVPVRMDERGGYGITRSDGRGKNEIEYYYSYKGEVNNYVPDGFGTIYYYGTREKNGFNTAPVARGEFKPILTYTGEIKKGKITGWGTLEYTDYNGTHRFERKKVFKGYFDNGVAKQGLLMEEFDYYGNASLFYSGGVAYDGGLRIVKQGYGTLYRSSVSFYDRADIGLPGAYYEGQFFQDKPAGFGVCNSSEYGKYSLGYLETVLTIDGYILNSYNRIGVKSDHLLDPTKNDQGGLPTLINQLLPDLSKVKTDSISLQDVGIYYGSTLNKMPYGLGYLEYSTGFRDYGFWKNGVKIPTKQLLASLLPDASMLEPNTRKYKSKEGKHEYDYYAQVNAQGYPIGWGWKIATGKSDDALPLAMNFKGALRSADGEFEADTIYSLLLKEHAGFYSGDKFNMKVVPLTHIYYLDKKAAPQYKDVYLRHNAIGINKHLPENFLSASFPWFLRSIGILDDDHSHSDEKKPGPDYFTRIQPIWNLEWAALPESEKQRIRQQRGFNALPAIYAKKIVLETGMGTGSSYIFDGTKNYPVLREHVSNLKENDMAWSHELRSFVQWPNERISKTSTVFYIRGYRVIPKTEERITGPGTKPTGGGTTISGSFRYVSGYNSFSAGSIISGTSMQISSPIYSSVSMSLSIPNFPSFNNKTFRSTVDITEIYVDGKKIN